MVAIDRASPFPGNPDRRDDDDRSQQKKRNIAEEEGDLLLEEVPRFRRQGGIEKLRPRQVLVEKIRPIAVKGVDQLRRENPIVENCRADSGGIDGDVLKRTRWYDAHVPRCPLLAADIPARSPVRLFSAAG